MVRRGITDEEIVQMIRDRKLLMGVNNIVLKYHESRQTYIHLKVIEHCKSGRGQYAIKIGDRYRKIGRAKLLWMLTRHEPVSEGMDVDHKDGDRFNDDPSNLRLRDSHENQCDNVSKQQLQAAMDYFDQFSQ